jgi:NHLM bacteriocin system ABC transporter ATP-binding protein
MYQFESQFQKRARLDRELTENAYESLARSLTGNRLNFEKNELERVDSAIQSVLKYNNVKSGEVPEDVEDFRERLSYMCRPSGTMVRDVRLEGKWYRQSFGPMLGKLKNGEIVALLPHGMLGYAYFDYNTGNRIRVDKKVAAEMEDMAILCYRPLPAKKLTLSDFFSFLIRSFDTADYALVFIMALVATLGGMLPAAGYRIVFDEVIPSGNTGLILPIATFLTGSSVAMLLFNMNRSLVAGRISQKLTVYAESALYSRSLLLPIDFYKRYSAGALAGMISQAGMIVELMVQMFLGGGLTVVLGLLYVVQIAFIAPPLALPALAISALQLVFIVICIFMTMSYEKKSLEANNRISGTVSSMLGAIQKIKLAGAENRAFAKWAEQYSEYIEATYRRPWFLFSVKSIVMTIGLLGGIGIYYAAGSGGISVAQFMAFNMSFGMISTAINQITLMLPTAVCIKPALELLTPILETVPETDEWHPAVTDFNGSVEMNHVAFRYNEKTPYLFENLSFKIKPGEYVAFVGKSGSGKSTIMRLLLGFEKPERGSIYFGKHDISQIDIRTFRKAAVGVVLQNAKMFSGTILDNIIIGTPGATEEDAWKAAEIAGIADDIHEMPMGMYTIVSEGSGGISGGQRQRIIVARTVCRERRVLMLDEATSALDNITQKVVAESLAKLKCTRIVVAHRLSTVKNCDRIMVVDHGTIAEEGTYSELIAKNGIFAELVKRQRLEE